jgi:hypothetical protein
LQWSNFEVGNLDWLRSKPYLDYFESLDKDGGFFYERWGDAPVHSIAAGLLLPKDEIHFFNDIAYYHVPFTHCPTGEKTRLDLRCHCDPSKNFDWKGYSCKSTSAPISHMMLITSQARPASLTSTAWRSPRATRTRRTKGGPHDPGELYNISTQNANFHERRNFAWT